MTKTAESREPYATDIRYTSAGSSPYASPRDVIHVDFGRDRSPIPQMPKSAAAGPPNDSDAGPYVADVSRWHSTQDGNSLRQSMLERPDSTPTADELEIDWRAFSTAATSVLLVMANEGGYASLRTLDENLTPIGWIGLARLMRAGYVDENGIAAYLTQSGEDFFALLVSHLEQVHG